MRKILAFVTVILYAEAVHEIEKRDYPYATQNCFSCLQDAQAEYCSNSNSDHYYDPNEIGYCCKNDQLDPYYMIDGVKHEDIRRNRQTKPFQCYSVPDLGYQCSSDFLEHSKQTMQPHVYLKYVRFTTCLDTLQIERNESLKIQNNDCGVKDLYRHNPQGLEYKKLRITSTDGKPLAIDGCVWRLFSRNETSDKRYLTYNIKYTPDQYKNSEMFLVHTQSETMSDIILFEEKQRELKEEPIVVNSLNYPNSEVYIIARVKDLTKPAFRFQFEFKYVEDRGLSAGGIIGILLAVFIFVGMVAFGVVLLLNRQGIISVYLPRSLRVLCLKGYLSAQEKADGIEYDADGRINYNRQLERLTKVKPGINGFIIREDSYISDHCEDSDFDPDALNPNLGFKVEGEVMTHILKRENLSIDGSPANSSVHESDEDMGLPEALESQTISGTPGVDKEGSEEEEEQIEVWIDEGSDKKKKFKIKTDDGPSKGVQGPTSPLNQPGHESTPMHQASQRMLEVMAEKALDNTDLDFADVNDQYSKIKITDQQRSNQSRNLAFPRQNLTMFEQLAAQGSRTIENRSITFSHAKDRMRPASGIWRYTNLPPYQIPENMRSRSRSPESRQFRFYSPSRNSRSRSMNSSSIWRHSYTK